MLLCTGSTALSGLQGQNILTVVCVWCPVCVCLQQTLLQEVTSKATTGSDNYRHIALLLFEERIYIQGARTHKHRTTVK